MLQFCQAIQWIRSGWLFARGLAWRKWSFDHGSSPNVSARNSIGMESPVRSRRDRNASPSSSLHSGHRTGFSPNNPAEIAISDPLNPSSEAGSRRALFVLRQPSSNKLFCWCLLLLVGLGNPGCVQRRLIVRSQPEGALVTIDNHTVGRTPVKVPFVYYGTRQIQLEKEGYKTVKVKERIREPWYEKVPISFFSNHFAFREIRDERLLDFELEPRSQVEENLLLDRANDLRLNSQRDTLTCPPNAPFQ